MDGCKREREGERRGRAEWREQQRGAEGEMEIKEKQGGGSMDD